jgi:hypothetical protein
VRDGLATCTPGHKIHPMLRSLVSAVSTACFALSVITWGRMPGCVAGFGLSSTHAAHQETSHQHPDPSGKLPTSGNCFVHLCCLQLVAPAVAGPAPVRSSTPARVGELHPAAVLVVLRPAHTLPFAHAPPRTPA